MKTINNERKTVFFFNKEINVKACFVKNLPEDTQTVVFCRDSFATYNRELSDEELDNMFLPTEINWESPENLKMRTNSLTDEIVNEWLQRVTAVAMPYTLDSPEHKEWEAKHNAHCKLIKVLAEELREVLKAKLGPNCKGCTLHGRLGG